MTLKLVSEESPIGLRLAKTHNLTFSRLFHSWCFNKLIIPAIELNPKITPCKHIWLLIMQHWSWLSSIAWIDLEYKTFETYKHTMPLVLEISLQWSNTRFWFLHSSLALCMQNSMLLDCCQLQSGSNSSQCQTNEWYETKQPFATWIDLLDSGSFS